MRRLEMGDLVFIRLTTGPIEVLFLPLSEVGPDPASYAADRGWIFEGRIEATSDRLEGHEILRENGSLVDVGWYLDTQEYALDPEHTDP